MIWVIIFVILFGVACFGVGVSLESISSSKSSKEIAVLIAKEEEKNYVTMLYDGIIRDFKNIVWYFSIAGLFALFVGGISLWDYKNTAMNDLMRGKYNVETVVKTKTVKGETVSDTTYVFSKIKEEK